MISTDARTAISSHGLTVEETGDPVLAYRVTGNTFPHKDALRRAGGRWSRGEQAWRFADAGGVEALARTLNEVPASPGLAEGAPSFAHDPGQPGSNEGGKKSWDWWGSKHYHGHRERLRERLLDKGPKSLADYEIIELLLFFSVRIRDTKPMAKDLIERFGSLGGVLAADRERLIESVIPDRPRDENLPRYDEDLRYTQVLLVTVQDLLERILNEKIKDRPLISSWTSLVEYLTLAMQHEPSEHFRILFLDRKNILIRDEVQSRGTVDHTPLYPREVVKRCLELAASAIIMVHNHPSGDPTPSKADVEMTRAVVEALKPVNITVHDHVIVGKNQHLSFRSHNLIA